MRDRFEMCHCGIAAGKRTETGGGNVMSSQADANRAGAFDADYFSKWNYSDRGRGAFSMYRLARGYYAALLRRFAPRGEAPVLEIGCGLGHLLALLQEDYRCVGVDVSGHAAAQSARQAPRAAVVRLDGQDLGAFRDRVFGAVVALHVVEHLPDPGGAIREVARVLRPGGVFLFATPNPCYGMRRWKDPATDAIGKDQTHISVAPPPQWRTWCEAAGLEMIRHFADGLWDVPYLPWIPARLQLAVLGLPAAIQVMTRTCFVPASMGVNQVCVARKPRAAPAACR